MTDKTLINNLRLIAERDTMMSEFGADLHTAWEAADRIVDMRRTLRHIARHFGSAEQCRELAQAALDKTND